MIKLDSPIKSNPIPPDCHHQIKSNPIPPHYHHQITDQMKRLEMQENGVNADAAEDFAGDGRCGEKSGYLTAGTAAEHRERSKSEHKICKNTLILTN